MSAVSDLHKRIVTGLYGQKCLALVYCTARPEPLSARTSGVLVYLRDGAAGVPVEPLADQTSADADRNRQWREVGVGAQILRDLGVSSIAIFPHPSMTIKVSQDSASRSWKASHLRVEGQ